MAQNHPLWRSKRLLKVFVNRNDSHDDCGLYRKMADLDCSLSAGLLGMFLRGKRYGASK
jgi:hypothetical protein